MTDTRVAQVATEVAVTSAPDARVAQVAAEVLVSDHGPSARVAQLVVEVVVANPRDLVIAGTRRRTRTTKASTR